MKKTLTIQLKLPEETNKALRIESIQKGITLKELCVKVLSEYAQGK